MEMHFPDTSRKYTPEEKQQLLQNLDIEVQHRVRQLEEWLADALRNFRLHQEGLISRIPKLVRSVSMGEFADAYDGDIQACLRGLVGGAPPNLEIDRETRKRKWEEASEGERAVKNARMMHATPKKKPPPPDHTGTAQRVRAFPSAVPRTPGRPRTTSRFPSVTPQKASALRTSPAKRPPSSATFSPALPAKAPAYPVLRAPRRDESMLSLNGSPLANPYQLGSDWFASQERVGMDAKGKGKETPADAHEDVKTLRRVDSILIRREASVPPVTQPTFSHTQTRFHTHTHARTNSRTGAVAVAAGPPPTASTHTGAASTSSARAVVAISTSDGHVLEFDPLHTSPRALDALVGITESAKKRAREDMVRLVQAAVNKWSIA